MIFKLAIIGCTSTTDYLFESAQFKMASTATWNTKMYLTLSVWRILSWIFIWKSWVYLVKRKSPVRFEGIFCLNVNSEKAQRTEARLAAIQTNKILFFIIWTTLIKNNLSLWKKSRSIISLKFLLLFSFSSNLVCFLTVFNICTLECDLPKQCSSSKCVGSPPVTSNPWPQKFVKTRECKKGRYMYTDLPFPQFSGCCRKKLERKAKIKNKTQTALGSRFCHTSVVLSFQGIHALCVLPTWSHINIKYLNFSAASTDDTLWPRAALCMAYTSLGTKNLQQIGFESRACCIPVNIMGCHKSYL